MRFDIDNPSGAALVTGASSGIGALYARRLAESGWPLVLVARRESRLQSLAEDLRASAGVEVETIAADLARPADLERVATRAAGDDVRLLVNNAGINGYGPFAEQDPDLLDRVLAVNVTAPTTLARAAIPGMLERGGGAIVNVASLLAFAGSLPSDPLPHRAAYAGTKGYLVTFSRTLAAELAGTPVSVQVLCPGLTATEFHLTAGDVSVPGEEEQIHDSGGMPAEDVVTASLQGLRDGEVVCVPGLAEDTALDRLADVEGEIRRASHSGLAQRYAGSALTARGRGRSAPS